MFVCLFDWLIVCLFDWLIVCLFVWLIDCLFVCLFTLLVYSLSIVCSTVSYTRTVHVLFRAIMWWPLRGPSPLLFESSWFVEPNLQEKLSPKAATTVLSKLRLSNGNDNGKVPNLETTVCHRPWKPLSPCLVHQVFNKGIPVMEIWADWIHLKFKWIVRRAITCRGNCLPFESSSQQIFVAKFVVKIVIFSRRGIVCCLGPMDLHGVIFYCFHLLPFASDGSKAALGTLKRMLEGGAHPPWSPEQNSGWYGCVKLFIYVDIIS